MATATWAARARSTTRNRNRSRGSRDLSPDIADDIHLLNTTKSILKRKSNELDSYSGRKPKRTKDSRNNRNSYQNHNNVRGSFVSVDDLGPQLKKYLAQKGKRTRFSDEISYVSVNKSTKVRSETNPYEYEPASLSPPCRSPSSASNSPPDQFDRDDVFESLVPETEYYVFEKSNDSYYENGNDSYKSKLLDSPCPSPEYSPGTPETISPLMSPAALSTSSTLELSPLIPNTQEELRPAYSSTVLQHMEARDYERPGKLLSLKLWNFMSHSNFEKAWHPNVNYIIGDNGSGKSAILTGILLGLGAKSSATGRATSAAGFIKHGSSSCKIEVVLSNDGSLDLDKYGNQIVVRRHIDGRGVSKYQIKTTEGKMRPLDRKEYDRIKLTLQIMPDNPLQFLNQETSKNFLRTGDPKRIYNYFYCALLLYDSEVLLKRIQSDIENTTFTLKAKKKGWDEMQGRADELKREYEVIVSMETAQEKIMYLEREAYWAVVIGLEKKFHIVEKNFNSVDEKVHTIKKEIKDIKHERESLKSGLESEASELKRLNQALRSKEAEKDQKRREISDAHVDLVENRVKLKECESTIVEQTKAIASLNEKVAKRKKELEANYERKRLEIETKRTGLEEKERALNEKIQAASNREQECLQDVENCDNVIRSDKFDNIELLKRRRNEKQRELTNINRAKSTPYDRFGVHMERLINKMNEHKHRFRHFPRGPQGMLYTVKPEFEKYTALVEFILYSSLYQFKVSCQEDFNLMNQLIKEVYGPKEIARVKRATLFLAPEYTSVYNLTLTARCKYPTVLDVLDIPNNDPTVINWLADGRGAERILLFPDFREACEIMKSTNSVPHSCTQGYTLDSRLLTPAPDFRCYVKNVMKTANIVQTTKFDKTAGIQEDIRQIDKEMDILNKELRQAKVNMDGAKRRLSQVQMELKELRKELVSVKKEIGQLDTCKSYVPDVASFLEDIQDREEVINQKTTEKGILITRVQEFETSLKVATTIVKELEEEIYKLQTEASLIEDKSGSVETQKNELNMKIKKLEVILGKLLSTRDGLKKEMDEVSVSLKKKSKDRHSKTKRIETKREPIEIKQEIDGLKTVLDKNKGRLKHKDEIYAEWKKTQTKADEVGKEIHICERLIKALAPTLKLQQDHFRRKKNEYGNTLQGCFHSLITTRQYGGSLVIDHNDRTLIYFVSRDNSSEARAMRNFDSDFKMVNKRGIKDFTSALSGGERAFATICFMISLWQTMEAPFFVLDEFDVFMDPFNRRASQNIISCHTRSQREAQFFFITPLSLDFMHSSEYTSVLRLYPPVRDISDEHAADKQPEPEPLLRALEAPKENREPTPSKRRHRKS